MYLSFKAAALGAAFFATSSFARENTRLCEQPGPIDTSYMVGVASDDLAFCDTKWDKGLLVTGIELWATKNHMKAFQLTYSDGTKSTMRGNYRDTEGNKGKWYDSNKLSWSPGEAVTKLNLAGSKYGKGDRFGGIWLNVGEQELVVKAKLGKKEAGEIQPYSSGIIVGAYGSAGDDIDSFGLLFLKGSVKKAEIIETKFPETIETLNKQKKGLSMMTVNSAIYKNSNAIGTPKQTFSFDNNQGKSVGTTLTLTDSKTFGTEISVAVTAKIEVPFVAELTTQTTAKASYSSTTSKALGETVINNSALTYSTKGDLEPQTATVCKAEATMGDYSTEYISVVKITMSNDQTFTVERPGNFHSMGYSKVITECKVVDIKEVGSNAEEIGGGIKMRAVSFEA